MTINMYSLYVDEDGTGMGVTGRRRMRNQEVTARALAVALAASIPATATANVPLPTVMAFNLSLWAGLAWFGALLILVTLIECAVLAAAYKQPWRWALKVAVMANIMSSAMGALLSAHPLEFLGLIVLFVLFWRMGHTRFQWSYGQRSAVAAGVVAAVVAVMMPWPTIPATVIQFYITIVAAFALSIAIEAFYLSERSGGAGRAYRWALGMNAFSYLALAVIMALAGIRSGTFAVHEWHVWQLRNRGFGAENREEFIIGLGEYYEWVESGSRSEWYRPHGSFPGLELMAVKRWAEDGDVKNARALYSLVAAYNTEDTGELWEDARAAITEADEVEAD